MKKDSSLMLFYIFIGVMLFMTGCATEDRYITTFTPEQKIPRHLDMNYTGPRANIAVGDFTVKASGAPYYIGDGLREMLETALFESLRFNVLDRLDPKGLSAEQKLSYSRMARPGSAKLGAQMGVAELMFYGAVTEFEGESSGAGIKAEAPIIPDSKHVTAATGSATGKRAHMAIDIRIVDTASGKVIAAKRIAGSAWSAKADLGASILAREKYDIPTSLGMFKNEPMEMAIRDCIYRSVIYACYALPRPYYRH